MIGDYAFRNATVAFDKIVLCADQGGTPSVGVSAFENSSSFDPTVTATTVASAKSDPNYVFAKDYTASGKITASSVSGIISIPEGAFGDSGVATSVDFSAFNGILNLGDEAFRGATNLGAVKIGKGITSVGAGCFASSTITSFDVASGGATSTPNWTATFSACKSLSSATIPSGVTSIGRQAFGGCKSLPSITIPSSVTEIGGSAFYDCTSLSSIFIPSSVSSLGKNIFVASTKLTSIVFGKDSASNGEIAFETNTKLITFPNISNNAIISESFVDLDTVMPNVTDFCVPYAQTKMGKFIASQQIIRQFLISKKIKTIRFGQSRTWYCFNFALAYDYPNSPSIGNSESYAVSSSSSYTEGSDIFKALTFHGYYDNPPSAYWFMLATTNSTSALDADY